MAYGWFMALGYISQLDLGPRWLLLPEPELQDRGEAHSDDESGTSDAAMAMEPAILAMAIQLTLNG